MNQTELVKNVERLFSKYMHLDPAYDRMVIDTMLLNDFIREICDLLLPNRPE